MVTPSLRQTTAVPFGKRIKAPLTSSCRGKKRSRVALSLLGVTTASDVSAILTLSFGHGRSTIVATTSSWENSTGVNWSGHWHSQPILSSLVAM